MLPTTNVVAFFDRANNFGVNVFDKTDITKKAHILQFLSADEGVTSNSYLLFKYQSASEFLPGTVIQAANDATVTATIATGANNDVFHPASIVSIDEGVYFIEGLFVRVAPQTIVLNPFSDLPSYRIGLEIDEQIVDELNVEMGDTLLDPANQNAPGAHRFRIVLTLTAKTLSDDADAAFIELARVIDGILQRGKTPPKFVKLNELIDLLARRTYDEAGDYIVTNFAPVISDDPETEDHFRLALGPGKAYVHGYEIQTTEPTNLSIRKGRVTANANNRTISTPVGNFVYALRVAASQPTSFFANTSNVEIHCANIASIDTTSGTTYNYSKIGAAKIRMIETFEVPLDPSIHANNTIFKLFFYDVQMDDVTGNVVSSAQANSQITLLLAAAPGVPVVNGAITGATIVLGGASSPVSGTFTVGDYATVNATHVHATLEEFLPTLPNGNTTYKLLFHSRDIDAFALRDAAVSSIDAPYFPNFSFQADVAPDSKIGGTPTGATVVSDTNDSVLVYQLPEKFITANSISVGSAVFKSWVKTTSNVQSFSGASNADFTLAITGNNFALAIGSLSATTAQENFVVFDQTLDAFGHGRILEFSDTPGATDHCLSNVTVVAAGSTYSLSFTFHYGSGTATTRSLVAVAKTTVSGLAVRQKTLLLGNTAVAKASGTTAQNSGQIEFYSLNAAAGFSYSLKTTDVFRISKILYKDSNVAFSNTDMSTATDVTAHFALDNGQRDNSYEYSQLIAKSTASSVVRPTGRLLVIFDWFKAAGRGYATVDSYLSSTNITKGMTYDIVPDYTSSRTNKTVSLRDVLDFRPVRSTFEWRNVALIFAADDASTNVTYLTSTGDSYLIPVSDDVWLGSYEFYLSRIDKIGLCTDGTFKVIEGQDAYVPKVPTEDNNTLLLFQLNIPPFTLVDANGKPTTVSLTTFGHKRYTMQDVSKIENRVAHLEYYTSLNSLEQVTRDQSILDANDNERFKNGIVVDSFRGADVADVRRPDYTASIDMKNRELRTAFESFAIQFAPDTVNSTSFGVKLIGDMAILDYTVEPFITQSLATHSQSVNPFDVASFYGTMTLSPAVDVWKAVDTKPAQVVDLGGPSEAWINANKPSFVQWGEWEQTWSGVVASDPQHQYSTPPGWTPDNHGFRSMADTSWNDVTTQTTYQQQGTTYEYKVDTTTASLGNRVLDVSVVHFCRKRDIVFSADGMKPASNSYAFFDGKPVTSLVQKANILQLASITSGPQFYVGQTVYVQKAITGNVAVTSGNSAIVGAGTVFGFELVAGQLVRIVQGVNTFDSFVSAVNSDTAATLSIVPGITLSAATLYTLTPVTIADVAARITGGSTQFTLKVVRANRDADVDSAMPYPITAGSLRPLKQVNDTANTTSGANLVVPASQARDNSTWPTGAVYTIADAICQSGIVRAYDAGSAALRFDTDIQDAAVATPGTVVYFVAGPGAGQSAHVVSYDPATQTAILDTSALTGMTGGQTIYSVGQPVSDGFIANNAVTSGRSGTIAGVFHLPEAVYPVGSRLFRLTDSANNVVSDATSTAEKNYTADGIAYTQQETSVTSRSLDLVRGGPATQSFTVQDTSVQGFNTQYVDPLAETFLVDAARFPLGIMLTSIDLCFASVPSDDVPVILEIRPVVNGYPASNQIVPCVAAKGLATVSLRPDAVAVSATPDFANSATVTTFTLPAPVNLLPGKEYAIVVRSDSDLYRVYTAELGASIIGSDAKVGKQPYAGSFFKSQNASTWTESPLEDLMFRLNRAKWTGTRETPQTGILVTRGVAPSVNTVFDSYEFYPFVVHFGDVTVADYQMDVKPENLVTEDLTGEVAVRYHIAPEQWSLLQARSLMQGYGGSDPTQAIQNRIYPFDGPMILSSNTVDGLVTLETLSTDVAPFVDLKKMNMVCLRHDINDMGLSNTDVIVVNPGSGYLPTVQIGRVTTNAASNVVTGDGNTVFTTVLAIGDTVVVGGNLEIVVSHITNAHQFETAVNVGITRVANDYWTYGTLGGNNAVVSVITDGNGTSANAYAVVGRDGKIRGLNFSATDGSVGSGYTGDPVIAVVAPVAGGGDFTVAQTQAELQYNSELDPSDGNALTRYMTQPVTLADGFDARDLTVTFDAYRPLGSHFYVYYKVLGSDNDTARFDDQPWRLMDTVTPDTVVSASYYAFKEFNFKTPNGRALDAATDTTDKFKVFAIKVVIASTNTVDVPRVLNFRAIALDA